MIKVKLLKYPLLVILFCYPLMAGGKGYYVNSVTGCDSHSGTLVTEPWKTLVKAESAILNPGDTLFFACGSSFTGGLEIKYSGTAEKPLVLTSYCSGHAPGLKLLAAEPARNPIPSRTFLLPCSLTPRQSRRGNEQDVMNIPGQRVISHASSTGSRCWPINTRETLLNQIIGFNGHCKSMRSPEFTNADRSILNGNAIRLSGDYLVVDGLYFSDCAAAPDKDLTYTDIWDVGAVRIMPGADHCTIKNCEFSNCPKGIQSTGEYALITHNYLHGANTRPLSSPGWGPIAIHMGNAHQEVSYNIIKDYYFIGGEFGADGGALELDDGRNPKTDIYIHHNYSSSNMGFLEVSWGADITQTETYHLRVAYNVSDDYQDFIMLWAPTHETYIENNTILRRKQIKNVIEPSVFCCDYGGVYIRNNIIAVDSTVTVFTRGNTDDHIHKHNLYWATDGSRPKIGTAVHPTELYNVDPQFADAMENEWDYSLKYTSPAIDNGINTTREYSFDFSGNQVPSGKSTDIGAFEFR